MRKLKHLINSIFNFLMQKKDAVKKKLDAYGLASSKDGELCLLIITTRSVGSGSINFPPDMMVLCNTKYSPTDVGPSGSVGLNFPDKSCAYEDHPNHVVIINTQPQFGQSLSTLANIDS